MSSACAPQEAAAVSVAAAAGAFDAEPDASADGSATGLADNSADAPCVELFFTGEVITENQEGVDERDMALKVINQARAEQGLAPLTWDSTLENIAITRSYERMFLPSSTNLPNGDALSAEEAGKLTVWPTGLGQGDGQGEWSRTITINVGPARESTLPEEIANCASDHITYAEQPPIYACIYGDAVSADIQAVLDRVNAIRKAACDQGMPDPCTNGATALTPEDYVPITWSRSLEYTARQRAGEAAVRPSHTRPDGREYYYASTEIDVARIGSDEHGVGLYEALPIAPMSESLAWFDDADAASADAVIDQWCAAAFQPDTRGSRGLHRAA